MLSGRSKGWGVLHLVKKNVPSLLIKTTARTKESVPCLRNRFSSLRITYGHQNGYFFAYGQEYVGHDIIYVKIKNRQVSF